MPFLITDITDTPPVGSFPPADSANDEFGGLVAIGGDWHPERILDAYRNGIFPWPMRDMPLGWFCPTERMVFRTESQPLGRRFRKSLQASDWTVTADTHFSEVLRHCAEIDRPGQDGTWIEPEMCTSYEVLHTQGHTHSLEVHDAQGLLIGGLFGVFSNGMFCGDSMFSAQPGVSRVAFAHLLRFLHEQQVSWVDGQVPNDYLHSLGGIPMARSEFLELRTVAATEHPLNGRNWSKLFATRNAQALCSA